MGKSRSKKAPIGLHLFFFMFLMTLFIWQCNSSNKNSSNTTMNKPSLKEVISRHSDEIMSVPGVVGIYEGETKEGKRCIKVMAEDDTTGLSKKIPKSLEGYPVIIEVTGKIKPMNQGGEGNR